jgi:hypothetical protein
MDYPVWECGDGADVGEVCKGWDMTDVGLIWEWEWGGGADVGEDYNGWDMIGFGLVWEWGDELCVCPVGEDGRGGQGERDGWEATLPPPLLLPLPVVVYIHQI